MPPCGDKFFQEFLRPCLCGVAEDLPGRARLQDPTFVQERYFTGCFLGERHLACGHV